MLLAEKILDLVILEKNTRLIDMAVQKLRGKQGDQYIEGLIDEMEGQKKFIGKIHLMDKKAAIESYSDKY